MESNYKVIREIGRGAAGIVSLVRRRRDNRMFAAKEIPYDMVATVKGSSARIARATVLKEVQVMRTIPHHPSIVSLEEVIESRESVFLILEYVDGGMLHDLVYPNGVPPAAREHHQNNMPGWLSYHQSGGGGFSPRNGAGGDAQAYGSDTWGESAMPIMSAAGTPGNFGAASGTMNATDSQTRRTVLRRPHLHMAPSPRYRVKLPSLTRRHPSRHQAAEHPRDKWRPTGQDRRLRHR
jgi:hypothetical protein